MCEESAWHAGGHSGLPMDGVNACVQAAFPMVESVRGEYLKGFAWHAGGYSGVPVDGATDCVQAAGFDHVLCSAWNLGDNSGPHNAAEVGSTPVTSAHGGGSG